MRFFLLLLSVSIIIASCGVFGGKRVRGDGNITRKQINVGDFTSVVLRGSLDIVVANAPEAGVQIEADENLHEYIDVSLNGNVLEVTTRRNVNLKPTRDIKIYASAPVLNSVEINGSGDISSASRISNPNSFKTEVRGSGDVQLEVDAPVVEANISGSGDVRLRGRTRNFNASVRGSGDIKAYDLMAENTSVSISGSGDAQVFASQTLNVEIRGAGDVAYRGNAQVSQSIKGAGSVKKTD